ncbi:MAG: GAF domain-containing protein [Polyangiaceae bacterium]|nr:GAF domain-containing protein [Polyangiaceae bacterium]
MSRMEGRISALPAELSADRLLQSSLDLATKLAGAEVGACFHQVGRHAGLQMVGLSGVDHAPITSFPRGIMQLVEDAISGRASVCVADISATQVADPDAHSSDLPFLSCLVVPIASGGEVVGALLFGHQQKDAFNDEHSNIAREFAPHLAVTLQHAVLVTQSHETIRQLGASNRELDEFAYVVSHDLKAPLRGIGRIAEWLQEDLASESSPAILEQLGLMQERVQRLESLIDGVLSYSRVGRLRDPLQDVGVRSLVDEVLDLLAPPTRPQIEVCPRLRIVTERTPFEQVLLNLISNAIRHAAPEQPQVVIGSEQRGDEMEYYVYNNGPGISVRAQEGIWQLFQTERDSESGTGIGLAVVRKLTQRQGGRAWVDSDGSRGATFRFTWPCARAS